MQRIDCPSCGAEVAFRASSSVMAVCEYCRSTLLKDAGSVRDLGKMSAVLEDYTPLKLQSSGRFRGLAFTVVGRIQLRYDAGLWNEWYLLFYDGSDGWLADASGQYMLTLRSEPPVPVPAFDALRSGSPLRFDNRVFLASDVRTARCVGGEGELPFVVGQGYTAKVVDFRVEDRFMTLDYSEGDAPLCYIGQPVTLPELECQLLRGDDEIGATADRYRGKAVGLFCPSCGSPIAYRAGK